MVSIKEIFNSLLRNPLLSDLTLEYVLDYAFEFMRIVGVKDAFTTKEIELDIKDYRAFLPKDFYKVEGVYKNNERIAQRVGVRHSKYNDHHYGTTLDYKIQGNVILTSFKEGKLTLRYLATPLDESGYPLIKDDAKYIRALESYIKMKQYSILYDTGKINGNSLQDARQQYAWHVGQAQSSMIDIDTMEAFVRANGPLLDSRRFKKDFSL